MTHAVGTKVKVTKAIGGLKVGDVTTITGYGQSIYPYRLADPSCSGVGVHVYDHEFEVVEPEPKFKVGDKVKHTRWGDEGTVVELRPPRHADVRVPGHSGASSVNPGCATFLLDELVKIERSPQEFKLKKGDRVKNLKTGRTGWVFHSPITNELAVCDPRRAYRGSVADSKVPAKALEAWEAEHPGTYDIVVEDKEPW